MGKRGPKPDSPFHHRAYKTFRAELGRSVEFFYGTRMPKRRSDQENAKRYGKIKADNLNTIYDISTIMFRRKKDFEYVYKYPWKKIKQFERILYSYLREENMVFSEKHAEEIYSEPFESCNKAIKELKGWARNNPSPEDAFHTLFKLNLPPEEVWPQDLASHKLHMQILRKLRQMIVEQKEVHFCPENLLLICMIAQYGAASPDEWQRDLESFLQCILLSMTESLGGPSNFFHEVARNGGRLAMRKDVFMEIVDGDRRRTVALSEIESRFKS